MFEWHQSGGHCEPHHCSRCLDGRWALIRDNKISACVCAYAGTPSYGPGAAGCVARCFGTAEVVNATCGDLVADVDMVDMDAYCSAGFQSTR